MASKSISVGYHPYEADKIYLGIAFEDIFGGIYCRSYSFRVPDRFEIAGSFDQRNYYWSRRWMETVRDLATSGF